jgi:hypothetical protein
MSRSESAQVKWRRIIGEQRSSGQTVAAFCRQRSVPQSSLFMWKRRLGSKPRRAFPPASFVAVKAIKEKAVGDCAGRPMELCLGHDRRLVVRRGFDRQLLLEVVAALEGLSS